MKLIIATQYIEGGKNKFGDIYVVENLTQKNIDTIYEHNGPARLKQLIEWKDGDNREYISDWKIVPTSTNCDDVNGDPPIKLTYLYSLKQWEAHKVQIADDWDNEDIVKMHQRWLLRPEGQNDCYACTYEMKDGSLIDMKETNNA